MRVAVHGLLAASACSFGSQTAPPDTSFDAGAVDAPPGAVTLTVRERGEPVVGVPVYFHEADGRTLIETMTDANGTAGAVIGNGGYASFIKRTTTDGVDEITTFAAVGPGDQLVLELSPKGRTDTATITVAAAGDPGAVSHLLYTTCGGPFGLDASAPTQVTLIGCGGSADMLLASFDDLQVLQRTQYQPSVSVETGSQVTFDGAFTSPAAATFSYDMVPADYTYVSTYQGLMTSNGTVFENTGGADVANASAIVNLVQPVTGATMLTSAHAYPPETEHGEQVIYEWGVPTTSYTLSFGASMLGRYLSTMTEPIRYDVASRKVVWKESAGLPATYVIAGIRVYRDDLPEGRAWKWRMAMPRQASPDDVRTTVAFPALPIGAFDLNPQGTDVVVVSELTSIRLPDPLGYADVRTHAFDDVRRWIVDQDGKMVIQRLFEPTLAPPPRIRYR
jgi:hypothetical protein